MEENKIKSIIKDNLEKELNEEYTRFKEEKLKDLDWEFEKKRNEIITSLVNAVSIEISRNMYELEPIINIQVRVEKRIINKGA